MYWQVYLHKTAMAAEKMLINTLKRAKELSINGTELFASPALSYFLKHDSSLSNLNNNDFDISHFANLDDNDIWSALKVWASHSDVVLSALSTGMVNRKLFKIEITDSPILKERIQLKLEKFIDSFGIGEDEARYFVSSDIIITDMYNEKDDSIDILYKDGTIKDISKASDMLNIELLSKKVAKHYFAYLRT